MEPGQGQAGAELLQGAPLAAGCWAPGGVHAQAEAMARAHAEHLRGGVLGTWPLAEPWRCWAWQEGAAMRVCGELLSTPEPQRGPGEASGGVRGGNASTRSAQGRASRAAMAE